VEVVVAAVVVDAVVEKHEEDDVNTRISSQKVKQKDEKIFYSYTRVVLDVVILQSDFNGYLIHINLSLSLSLFFYG
jgi:tRNA threonylcarbamoyladenosine modification (KEOPS) complex  Pcc1 subunit